MPVLEKLIYVLVAFGPMCLFLKAKPTGEKEPTNKN